MKISFNIIVLSLLFSASASYAEKMSIQVKQSYVRTKPSYLGRILYPVGYAERIEVVKERGNWFGIKRTDNKLGWLHESALTMKEVQLRVGDELTSNLSGREIALAGKGFNSDIEFEYKAFHKDIDFKWVDYMESISIRRTAMRRFLTAGKVEPFDGDGI